MIVDRLTCRGDELLPGDMLVEVDVDRCLFARARLESCIVQIVISVKRERRGGLMSCTITSSKGIDRSTLVFHSDSMLGTSKFEVMRVRTQCRETKRRGRER